MFNWTCIFRQLAADDVLDLESLEITERTPLSTASQQSMAIDKGQLSQDITDNLASIRATYLTAASALTPQLQASRCGHL